MSTGRPHTHRTTWNEKGKPVESTPGLLALSTGFHELNLQQILEYMDPTQSLLTFRDDTEIVVMIMVLILDIVAYSIKQQDFSLDSSSYPSTMRAHLSSMIAAVLCMLALASGSNGLPNPVPHVLANQSRNTGCEGMEPVVEPENEWNMTYARDKAEINQRKWTRFHRAGKRPGPSGGI
ncbi:hypothetical protein BDN72DRAFT_858032 [Pluteus cervinus]|uniref:Uncharacterized protein n=1 Tax=Pluteus cervinus TaxID=181527 RepID=A0ACD3ATR7_9AGAR|nr:hypothetical protein BDN72DRAFT_858032 [Pluteus cervinus]